MLCENTRAFEPAIAVTVEMSWANALSAFARVSASDCIAAVKFVLLLLTVLWSELIELVSALSAPVRACLSWKIRPEVS